MLKRKREKFMERKEVEDEILKKKGRFKNHWKSEIEGLEGNRRNNKKVEKENERRNRDDTGHEEKVELRAIKEEVKEGIKN